MYIDVHSIVTDQKPNNDFTFSARIFKKFESDAEKYEKYEVRACQQLSAPHF